jgi:large subunit ribosomal protein L25
MSTILEVKNRELGFSKGELNKWRKKGIVPAILFGKGIESIPLFVDLLKFQKAFKEHGKIFEIQLGSEKHLINAKKFTKNALGNTVLHIDFYKLKKGQKTTVEIPVHTIGDAIGEKEGGIISLTMNTIKVTAVPSKVPEHIDVDVTELAIGDVIHVKDLPKIADVEFEAEDDATVVSCAAPKAEAEPEVEAAAEGEETTTPVDQEKTEASGDKKTEE